ncbi:alpha-L-fucosidase [Actinospica robiniae]|uniref:alpha-L-fucosidase n=1 Tax=Actinospica robiniae TaxID=304901 RepID=UPI000419ACE3|nr:alpha-L-fucosidase [Actinospica robiniae]
MTLQPWFSDAKFGIFIHYGIYAVDGVAESWSMFTGEVPREQYMKQLAGFTAANYDPEAWAELFARVGAKYAVLTSKHHDGVALWEAQHSDLNVIEQTPAGRDLVTPFTDALRKRGLKVGLYFSHADWSHPDYATVKHGDPGKPAGNPLNTPPEGEEDPARWERFRSQYHDQVRDLITRFRPDLLWFDGEWERTDEQWGFQELGDTILAMNPQTVLNGRIRTHADYATPELSLPVVAPDGPWELCLTINDAWGYRHADTNHKSVGLLVRYLAETVGMGGNLLLDVGPREDGTIPQEQVERLEGLGAWIAKHADAVHGTRAGLPAGHHHGPSTLSADGRTLYLICFAVPRAGVAIKGLRTPIRRVSVLGSGTELAHRVYGGFDEFPGLHWIEAPTAADADPHATVLAVELDGELDLYRGMGHY